MKKPTLFLTVLAALLVGSLRAQKNSSSPQETFPADQGGLAAERINGQQLEQMLAAPKHGSDVKLAKQLSGLELTERLSAASSRGARPVYLGPMRCTR